MAWKPDIVGPVMGHLAVPTTASLVWVLDRRSPGQIRPVLLQNRRVKGMNRTSAVHWQPFGSSCITTGRPSNGDRNHWDSLHIDRVTSFTCSSSLALVRPFLSPFVCYSCCFWSVCPSSIKNMRVSHVICDTLALWIQSKCSKNVRNSLRMQR